MSLIANILNRFGRSTAKDHGTERTPTVFNYTEGMWGWSCEPISRLADGRYHVRCIGDRAYVGDYILMWNNHKSEIMRFEIRDVNRPADHDPEDLWFADLYKDENYPDTHRAYDIKQMRSGLLSWKLNKTTDL